MEEEEQLTHVMEEVEPDQGNGEAEPDQPPHGASGTLTLATCWIEALYPERCDWE